MSDPLEEHELYALGSDRSAHFIRVFVNHFLPGAEAQAEDYPVPACVDAPEVVFTTVDDLLAHLETHPREPYATYWSGTGAAPWEQAMVFHTRDGHAVFGIVYRGGDPLERLRELAAFVGADYAYVGWEAPPPDSARAFKALCRKVETLSLRP
ncbi:Hypothetical protein A7982_08797 [Minicystis rosea]|nr:Hypothetical protein A7982_08797 [Minicystis rosea]